jgi:hypothetical protein
MRSKSTTQNVAVDKQKKNTIHFLQSALTSQQGMPSFANNLSKGPKGFPHGPEHFMHSGCQKVSLNFSCMTGDTFKPQPQQVAPNNS